MPKKVQVAAAPVVEEAMIGKKNSVKTQEVENGKGVRYREKRRRALSKGLS